MCNKCIKSVCSDGCGNGQCTSPDKCTCSPEYTGASCITPQLCTHPTCNDIQKCALYTIDQCLCVLFLSILFESDCPESEGFFGAPGTRQCMKTFMDKTRSWDGAESLCRSQGLKLAKPQDAAALNKYLNEKHGKEWYWVSARGTGSGGWQWTDGEVLSLSDPLWGDGEPDSTSRGDCLYLYSHPSDIAAGTPYYDAPCSYTRPYPLCEVISEF
ncbi:unnamed protein product, partial [Meganyctiphanes norvegica]